MNSAKILKFCLFLRLSFFLVHQMLLFRIPLKLFSFNVFEHIFWFRQTDIVRKDLGICVIKSDHFWKSRNRFILFVMSLEKLAHVVKDEIVFENRDNVRLLIVNDVIDDFSVVVLFRRQVLLLKIVSNDLRPTDKSRPDFIHSFNRHYLRTVFWIFHFIYFCLHIDTELTISFWLPAQKDFGVWFQNGLNVTWCILIQKLQILKLEILFFPPSSETAFLVFFDQRVFSVRWI